MASTSQETQSAPEMGSSFADRPWQQYGRCRYYLGDRSLPLGIRLADIGDSLAKINRFTGHSLYPLSVARHCLYVSRYLQDKGYDPLTQLYGLVHDAPETVVNDLSHPLKMALGEEGIRKYRELEDAAQEAIFKFLSVPYPMPKNVAAAVKHADRAAVMAERRDLMPPCDAQWISWEGVEPGPEAERTYGWHQDSVEWCERFNRLRIDVETSLYA